MTTSTIPVTSSVATINPAMPLQPFVANMDLQQKADWLLRMLENAINDVAKKRTQNQSKASRVKLSSILLSGCATIILGLQAQGFEAMLNNVAFIMVSLVTLLSAIEPFFNYRALWIEHELGKHKFHRLKDELEYYLAGLSPDQIDGDKLNEFHERYQKIWIELSASWIDNRKGSRYSV